MPAGGYTQAGDKRHPYVTQPNGEREGVKRKAVFADKVPKPDPGAVVFVPTRTARSRGATSSASSARRPSSSARWSRSSWWRGNRPSGQRRRAPANNPGLRGGRGRPTRHQSDVERRHRSHALYSASGPTTNGSFRRVESRRGRGARRQLQSLRPPPRQRADRHPAAERGRGFRARARRAGLGGGPSAPAPPSTSSAPPRRCATTSASPAGSIPLRAGAAHHSPHPPGLPRVPRQADFRGAIILMNGRSIHMPKFDPILLVEGAADSPSLVSYTPGNNLDWYVNAAGGLQPDRRGCWARSWPSSWCEAMDLELHRLRSEAAPAA